MGAKAPQPKPKKTVPLYSVSEKDLAKAFTEWDRRYREEPERFESEAVHLIRGNPKDYGERCAPYMIGLLTGTI